jgi:hypothetical protein
MWLIWLQGGDFQRLVFGDLAINARCHYLGRRTSILIFPNRFHFHLFLGKMLTSSPGFSVALDVKIALEFFEILFHDEDVDQGQGCVSGSIGRSITRGGTMASPSGFAFFSVRL